MDSTAERVPPSARPTPPEPPVSRKRRPWGRRAAIAVLVAVALVALYAALGFFALPAYLETKIPEVVSTRLDLPATVGDVRFNPFTLALTVRGFHISESDDSPLVGFEELLVNLAASSFVTRAWVFDQIRIRIPYARIIVDEDGELNLKELEPAPAKDRSSDQPGREPEGEPRRAIPPVIIRALSIENGVVEFHDRSRPTPYSVDIVPIWLTLNNFATRNGEENTFAFGAEFDLGETVNWQGRLQVNPLRSDGRIAMAGIKARGLWEYVRDQVGFEVRDGTVQAEAAYQLEIGGGRRRVQATDGSVRVAHLTVFEPGGDAALLSLPAVMLQDLSADLEERRVTIGAVDSQGAAVRAAIEPDGRLDLQRVLAVSAAREVERPRADEARGAVDALSAQPWTIDLKTLTMEDAQAVMEDRRTDAPVHLELSKLSIRLDDLSYPSPSRARLDASAAVNTTGTINANGEVRVQPIGADLQVQMAKLPLVPFQAYLNQVAAVDIKSGVADVTGRLVYQAGDPASVEFHGEAGITDLKTVDAHLDRDLLNWDRLTAGTITLRLPERRLAVEEIIVRRPYAEVIIAEDRSVNLKTVMNNGRATEPIERDRGPATAPLTTTIDAVRIVDGSAHFADLSIQPQVDTGIYRLNGSVRGLSSDEKARAKVALHGEVDKYAPVTIAGRINPLSTKAFTDLHVSFKNVNLTTLSPYSRKFAGYPIEKGKLSMDIDYRLARGRLEADNEAVIDQLTLGEKVDSPDATSLPVKLVVALLKDRHGRINLQLPVRGDLNDPDFHYGRLVWNAMVNLFQKIIASPFAWLGNLIGRSGEELSEVRFPLGRTELPAEDRDKLEALAASLEDRPALQLEVTGTADPITDRAALRELILTEQLTALKQAAAAGGSRIPGGPRPDKGPDEEARWIEALYIRTFGGLPEELEHGEGLSETTTDLLRARLLEGIAVEDDRLRRLAQQRAAAVQEFLVNQAGVPPDRVFMLGVRLESQADGDRVPTRLSVSAG
ncbi:DUF748 domain-containing protein [Candidatus Nitrospira bockiana]